MTFLTPPAGTYAVVEVDFNNTVESLDDPIATAAVADIQTAKCIVYLDAVLCPPCAGNNNTATYAAHPIGPGIRPEDPERCITPDMCVPIFPNTYHPSGDREPVKPHPRSFPFNNGYHWFGSDVQLELRIRADDCTYTAEQCLVSLPADQQVNVERLRTRDMWWELDIQQARDGALNANNAFPQANTASLKDIPLPPSTPTLESPEDAPTPTSSFLAYCESVYGIEHGYLSKIERPSSDHWSLSGQSAEDTPSTDVFDLDYNERDTLLPIVKIWLDVGAHFAEGVPDPTDFLLEYYWILSVVQESKARAKNLDAAGPHPPPNLDATRSPSESAWIPSVDGEKRKRSQGE
ncbi:hypothetical protein VTO73DRAFT_12754 [Trametes versicolor]